MGRKPKPTNLKILEGTYRPDRGVKNEARPTGVADAPAWMSPKAAEIWADVVPHLARVGLATGVDASSLGRYCELFATYLGFVDDARSLKVQRYHETAAGALRVHPAYDELRRCASQMLELEREFGMTPSARTRVEAAPSEDEVDEWAKRARRAR